MGKARVYSGNPFVLSVLELIQQHRGQDIDIGELSALLGGGEPRLSPRNLQRAAREAAVESEMAGIHSDAVDEEAA